MNRSIVRPHVTYDRPERRGGLRLHSVSRLTARPRRVFILAAWLGGLSTVLSMPAAAADAETDAKIKALEEQVQALSTQIQDLKVGTASKYAETQKQITAVAPTLTNGRPTLTSADGAFSASLRSLVRPSPSTQ